MDSIRKTQKQRRVESDSKIISSAIKCFAESGYTYTSLIQIAKNAGVTGALISQRYGSKESLFIEAYNQVVNTYKFDVEENITPEDCLRQLLNQIKKINIENPAFFEFCCMIHKSTDLPLDVSKNNIESFKKTNMYKVLLQAQTEGMLPSGNLENLISCFISNAFLHILFCKQYGMEIPNDEYYFKSINFVDKKTEKDTHWLIYSNKAYIKEQIIEILCKDFQALWLINLNDMSLEIFKMDTKKIIPGSVESASKIRFYDEARLWYIENNVLEVSKEKLLQQTALEYVMPKLEGGEPFFIEYGRKNVKEINFNQLCYDKIVNPVSNKPEYVILGFRDVDITKKIDIDDITGLYNRQTFFSKAEKMLAKNPDKQFDLVLSDIVDFKKINETYGSDIADEILSWHGRYLATLLIDDMVVIGRYGGDQMVMLGTHEYITKCCSSEYAERFKESESSNGLPSIKFKYGIYLDIRHGNSIISACDKAHMALNSIKNHYSREIEYYSEEIKNHLEKQRKIEECMRSSLKKGDFKVYYQPKHDAKTGKLVGAEALIRWIHPEYGFMSPADFIPLFEQNGFIMEIDNFVGNRTCENLRRWMDKGIECVPVSINVSRITLARENLIDDIQTAITQYNLLPNQLHMEVTETIMSENIGKLAGILNKIRELGFMVELDDFGSGYSSLNILSTFPIDILKLDMAFMQQFGDKKRSIVLESCINLAKKLGFKTVSEGVELEEQKNLLEELGADMIQGYFYSKPLSEDEFEQYMSKNC